MLGPCEGQMPKTSMTPIRGAVDVVVATHNMIPFDFDSGSLCGSLTT